MLFKSVTVYPRMKLEKSDQSVVLLKIDMDNKKMSFESIKKDGNTLNIADFDKVSLNGRALIISEEGGERQGIGHITLNVKCDKEEPEPTPTPTAAPTLTPTPTATPTVTPAATPSPTVAPTATPTPDADDIDITKEIPYAENIDVPMKEEVIKKTNTDTKDVDGSTQKYLMLKIAPKKTSIKLSWKKIAGADGYVIYGAKCGKKMEPLVTIPKAATKTYTFKKLKKGTYYKYLVVAYKKTSAGDKVITTSKSVHATTDGGRKGNPVKLKLKKTKLSVKKGKTVKIKASFTKKKKVATHIAKFRYESVNPAIATIDKNGNIKGVSKGKTKIYVYTQNGICKTVTITVK